MTLKRLMITVGVLSLVVGVLIAWYWQFACTPEGKARNLFTQYRKDTSSLRGWMIEKGLIKKRGMVPEDSIGLIDDYFVNLGPDALPPLLEAMEDKSIQVRWLAVRGCGRFRDPRAIDPLIKRMGRHSDPKLKSDEEQVCFQAVRALVEISSCQPEQVIRALSRPDITLCDDVPGSVHDEFQERAAPYLIALLNNRSAKTRGYAASFLGSFHDPQVLPPLRNLLRSPVPPGNLEESLARVYAAGAMAMLNDKEGIDALLSFLKSTNTRQRECAVTNFLGCDPSWALAPLQAIARDKEPEVRHAVADVLGSMSDLRALPTLEVLAADPDGVTADVAQRHLSPESVTDCLARGAFRWFEDARLETTGLVADRWANKKPAGGEDKGRKEVICSIASVGYFLSVLPEAAEQGWITRDEAARQARTTLEFCRKNLDGKFGLYYHFVDWRTGKRAWNCEVSILDSAIFFNGCLVAAEAFGGEVAKDANAMMDGADWTKFVAKDPRTGKELLSLGWEPQKGLLTALADVRSSEFAMPYFLAVGSRTHAISPQCWYNTRVSYRDVCGYRVLNGEHPLFTSYYGLGWHGLKGLKDKDGVDLEENAKQAALANREFCKRLGSKHATFRAENGSWWGISAGDSAKGYVAPGPVGDPGSTVWPTTALAALPFIPDEIKQDLNLWRASKPWKNACGYYGLAPFDLEGKWTGPDLIGIDVGSFLLNYQNARNSRVRELWARHPVGKSALEKLGYLKPAPATSARS